MTRIRAIQDISFLHRLESGGVWKLDKQDAAFLTKLEQKPELLNVDPQQLEVEDPPYMSACEHTRAHAPLLNQNQQGAKGSNGGDTYSTASAATQGSACLTTGPDSVVG